eukprot:403352671
MKNQLQLEIQEQNNSIDKVKIQDEQQDMSQKELLKERQANFLNQIPFHFEKVRSVDEILDELKDLLPIENTRKKRHNFFDKPKNPYVLRSLDKLRNMDKRQKHFQDKIENMRDHMAVYESLQAKPAVEQLLGQHPKDIDVLIQKTRNQLHLNSNKSEDKKFTSTFYNNKNLKVPPLAFKNDVFKAVGSDQASQQNPNDSVMTQLGVGRPHIEFSQQSKLKRYVKNTKILETLKKKLQRNPTQKIDLINTFIKLSIPEESSLAITELQISNLLQTIQGQGFNHEIMASFEFKDIIRHGLLLEDLNLRLQLLQMQPYHDSNKSVISESQSTSIFHNHVPHIHIPGSRPMKSTHSMSQLDLNQSGMGYPNTARSISNAFHNQDISDFQRDFMMKRKKAEDNLERYERDANISNQNQSNKLTQYLRSSSQLSAQKLKYNDPTNQAQTTREKPKSFLERYIDSNKVRLNNVVERFPSIEANRKFSNEFSPKLVDSKQIIETIKQAQQERVFRKNKLLLEKLIAERKQKQAIEESVR